MVKNFIKEYKFFIIFILLLFFITKPTFVLGESMQPTLQNHDLLLTEKVSTYKNSFNYGDIVTFNTNIKLNSFSHKVLIKRVIGIQGDVITISNGNVYRNGTQLNEPYIGTNITYGDGVYVVPENSIFALGDNREHSSDSRDPAVGFINVNEITGVVYFRAFPIDSLGILN